MRQPWVYNKAFYLLANKPGWNVKKAFQVFAKANESYWISTTNFNNGACGVQSATADLGYPVDDVVDSFQQPVHCPIARLLIPIQELSARENGYSTGHLNQLISLSWPKLRVQEMQISICVRETFQQGSSTIVVLI